MPEATYRCEADSSAQAIRELAKDAASATGQRFHIFAAQYSTAAWYLHEDKE
jgi:hypothetical protein